MSSVVTSDWSKLVDAVRFRLEWLTFTDQFYDVGSFIERTAQTSLPASIARCVNTLAVLSRILSPLLHSCAPLNICHIHLVSAIFDTNTVGAAAPRHPT